MRKEKRKSQNDKLFHNNPLVNLLSSKNNDQRLDELISFLQYYKYLNPGLPVKLLWCAFAKRTIYCSIYNVILTTY